MRMSNKTASIIANLTSSMGKHVRPKIIIKKASRSIQTGYSASTLALLMLAILLFCVTLFFVGGIVWYFFGHRPEDEVSVVPIEPEYQLDAIEHQFLEMMGSPNRQSIIMAKTDDIITAEEFKALARRKDPIMSFTTHKDGISDASTNTKTQSSQMGTLTAPELLEEKAASIIRLMQEGKKSFSLKLMSSSLEDID